MTPITTEAQGARDNRAEFEKLVARTQRKAYNMAYRMTGNREDAEDLVQDAYLRAFHKFDLYDRAFPFEGWFFRILSNLFLDSLRRKRRLPILSLDRPLSGSEDQDGLTCEIPDPASNPEIRVMRDVLDERLQDALASLPPAFRIAVLLCDVEGLSYEEIARRMGTSIGTVRSRIHRGRQMLRCRIAKQASASWKRVVSELLTA